MSVPAHAVARSETRVGNFFPAPPKSASADLDQTLEPRRKSRGCDYDFASGVHKYLYAHANPVNGTDPSGNMTLKEVMVTATTWAAVRLPFVAPTLYAAHRGATRINVVSLANAFRSLYYGVGNQVSRIPINLYTGQQFEKMVNPAMRLLGGVRGQSIRGIVKGTMRTAKPDWMVWGKHLVDAKLGQAINVTGQQFQVMLHWAAREGGSITYITLNKPPAPVITEAINAGRAAGVRVSFWHILPF